MQEEQRRMKEMGHDLESTELGFYTWAQQGLAMVETPPDMENEQPIFWHIPKVSFSIVV